MLPWDLFWTTLDTWLPNLMAIIKMLPTIFDTLINFEYKKFIISCSYLYYYTVFFLTVRILIYTGVTLINLINIKHTTLFKKKVTRIFSTTILKFYSHNSFKESLVRVAAVIYL